MTSYVWRRRRWRALVLGAAGGWWRWASSPLVPDLGAAPVWASMTAVGTSAVLVGLLLSPLGPLAAVAGAFVPVVVAGVSAGLVSWVGREIGGADDRRTAWAVAAEASCPLALAVAAGRAGLWPVAAGLAALSLHRAWSGTRRALRLSRLRMIGAAVLAAVVVCAALMVLLGAYFMARRLGIHA